MSTNLKLIRPYEPNPALDWLALDTTGTRLFGHYFRDLEVQREFEIFCHRDAVAMLPIAAFIIAVPFLVSSGIVVIPPEAEGVRIVALVCTALSFVYLALDVYLYTRSTLTHRICRSRRVLQQLFLLTMGTTCFLAPYPFYQVASCSQRSFDPIEDLGGRPVFSDQELRWYCLATVEPVHLIMAIPFTMLPFSPFVTVPMALYMVTLQALAPVFLASVREYESSAEIIGKIMVTVTILSSILVLNALRYFLYMRQFRLAVQVKKETLSSERQAEDIDALLCSMLPGTALERLSSNLPVSDYSPAASVLFSDIAGFTAWSSSRTAHQVVQMLNSLCREIDRLCFNSGGIEKIKTIGDAYWAVSGLPTPCDDHAEKVADFGNGMLNIVQQQNKRNPGWNGVRLRIGVHSGPLYGGILGTQQLSYEVWGETNTLANNAEQNGAPDFVSVSEITLNYLELDSSATHAQVGTIPAPQDLAAAVLEQQLPHQTKFANTKSMSCGATIPLYALHRMPIASARKKQQEDESFSRVLDLTSGRSDGEHMNGANSDAEISPALRPFDSRSEGAHSSHAVRFRQMSEEEAKKSRAKLLQQREAARTELGIEEPHAALATETSMEELVTRYSERKFNWVVMDFKDAEIESEFMDFVVQKQQPLRTMSRIAALALLLCLLVSVALQGGEINSSSAICFGLASACGILAVFLSVAVGKRGGSAAEPREKGETNHTTGCGHTVGLGICFAMHMTALNMVLGAGMMQGGQSVATNDIAYLHAPLTCLLGLGNVGMVSAASILVSNLLLFTPLMIVFTYKTVYFSLNCFLFLFGMSAILVIIVVVEKQYRHQFLEHRVALFLQEQEEQRGKEREALLASMVPAHCVKELRGWMVTMDPTRPIVQSLPAVCVGFVQTYQLQKKKNLPACHHQQQELENELSSFASKTPLIMVESVPGHVGVTPPLSPLSQIEGASEGVHLANFNESPSVRSLGHQQQQQTNEMDTQFYLQHVHTKIDSLLKKFKTISKIKSIGDFVMLAGPFKKSGYAVEDVTEACDEMLAAVFQIRSLFHCRAGLHVGEVMGAVLGTSRLCYDIFGDTVNTTSRTMTATARGEVGVSESFYNAHPSQAAEVDVGFGSARDNNSPVERNDNHQTSRNPSSNASSAEMDAAATSPIAPSASPYLCTLSPASFPWLTRDARFSCEPEEVQAKGKGTILVRKVLSVPPLDVDKL